MANSTASASLSPALGKPEKPYPEFPLFPHATRRWAKKIRGRMHYFGRWDDPQGALDAYLDVKDALHAGRTPRPKVDGVTIRDVVNRFLSHKKSLLVTGELSPRTFQELHATCKLVVKTFGKNRLASDLDPVEFDALRRKLARRLGVVALGNHIQRVRSVFKFAFESDLIDRPQRFGPGFKKPSKKSLRLSRAEQQRKHGLRMFSREDCDKLLKASGPSMKAMILLALNGGLGQSDIANLPRNAIDMGAGWLNFARVKTGIPRRVPLWPETTAALRAAVAERPKAKSKEDDGLVFLTKSGQRWVRLTTKNTPDDVLGQEFSKLAVDLGVKRPGLSFYGLRHTFQTIAEGARDMPAVAAIMGHADASMAAQYREQVVDERLKAVTDHVHAWLFPKEKKGSAKKQAKPAARAKSKVSEGKAKVTT